MFFIVVERGMEFDAKKLPMPDKELKESHDSRSKAALKLFDSIETRKKFKIKFKFFIFFCS